MSVVAILGVFLLLYAQFGFVRVVLQVMANIPLAMVGAVLGWPHVWLTLLLASVTGALVGVGLAVTGGSMKARLPFGTFLAVAALVSSYWGEPLIDWYVRLLTVQ